jgi:hypothetical protein
MTTTFSLSLLSRSRYRKNGQKKEGEKKETRKGDMSKDIENVQNSSNSISKLYI